MAIDIRAITTCSLGELIQGSISDSPIEESGLILTSGSCVINDIIVPDVGQVVTFSYTKNGVTKDVPRVLRVLSSFADPVRRITQVKLGCKLTYLSDLRDPTPFKATDDPLNASFTEADKRAITIPISASSVLDYCLTKLDLTVSSNTLTNKFSIAEFSLSNGYVNVIDQLLVSECLCGYLDENEVLQIFDLNEDGGTGPVLQRTDLIELDSLGFGERPADKVVVSYDSIKFKPPESSTNYTSDNSYGYNFEQLTELRNWERSLTITDTYSVPVTYTPVDAEESVTVTFNGRTESENLTTYKVITVRDIDAATGRVVFKQLEVVNERTSTTREPLAKAASGLIGTYLSYGYEALSNGDIVVETQKVKEEYVYDFQGNQTGSITTTYGSGLLIAASSGMPPIIPTETSYLVPNYGGLSAIIPVSRREVQNEKAGTRTLTRTVNYSAFLLTTAGQKASGEAIFTNTSSAEYFFNSSLSLVYESGVTEISQSGLTQARPAQAERLNAVYSNGGDPNNNYRLESEAEITLISGSQDALRETNISLPYAPDDYFTKSGSSYSVVVSDANTKAVNYGRVQNKFLMGNRNGMTIQVDVDSVPARPLSPIIIELNGYSVLYKTNNLSYAFNTSGIVVGVDALFWGAIGGTGTGIWFPVAPGVVSLPSTPPIIDGQMTVTNTVPPWNEVLKSKSIIRVKLNAKSYNYPLYNFTQIGYIGVRIDLAQYSSNDNLVAVPEAIIALAANTPVILGGGVNILVPSASVLIGAYAPSVQIASIDGPGIVLAFTTKEIAITPNEPIIVVDVLVEITDTVNIDIIYFEETEEPATQDVNIILNEILETSPGTTLLNYISDTFLYEGTGSEAAGIIDGGNTFIIEEVFEGIPIVSEFFVGYPFEYYQQAGGVYLEGYISVAIGGAVFVETTVINVSANQVSILTNYFESAIIEDTVNIVITPNPIIVITNVLEYYYSMPRQLYTWQNEFLPEWWGN